MFNYFSQISKQQELDLLQRLAFCFVLRDLDFVNKRAYGSSTLFLSIVVVVVVVAVLVSSSFVVVTAVVVAVVFSSFFSAVRNTS